MIMGTSFVCGSGGWNNCHACTGSPQNKIADINKSDTQIFLIMKINPFMQKIVCGICCKVIAEKYAIHN
jgi:hypothetical protein